MRLSQRLLTVGQHQPLQHRLRQALRHHTAQRFEQMEDRLALPARGQPRPAQRFVDRRNAPHFEQPRFGVVRGVGQQLPLRLNHFEVARTPRRLDPPVDGHRLPGVEFAFQVAAVEPDALQRQPSLAHGQLEDRGFARLHQQGAAHLGDHRGCLAGLQLIQGARILPVLVAKGQVVEQILGGEDAFGREQLRHARTHALHIHHRTIEVSHTPDAKWRAYAGTNAP